MNNNLNNKLVPDDFGTPGGTEISNKNTILDDVAKLINKPKKPTFEYIVTMPYSTILLPFKVFGVQYGFSYSIFGHSAIRYINSETGEDIVVNINKRNYRGGKKIEELADSKFYKSIVEFYPAEEYFFGLNKDNFPPQGGIYNRNIHTIRIDSPIDKHKIEKLHSYFKKLEEDSHNGSRLFNLVNGPIYNFLRLFIPSIVERGNCSYWISKGLKESGIINHKHIFPRNIWIELFENYNPNKTSVIYYHQVQHSKRVYGFHEKDGKPIFNQVALFQPLQNYFYSNAQGFAKCHVKVPENSLQAEATLNPNPYQPSRVRNLVNNHVVITGSLLVTGLFTRKMYIVSRARFINWKKK